MMIKIDKELKKSFRIGLLLLIIGIFIGPVLIHYMYWLGEKYPFIKVAWDEKDMLAYYGAVLSFLGTTILGALTLYQNKSIQAEADKRVKLIEERELISNMPKFLVKMCGYSGKSSKINFEIENVTQNMASEVILYDIHIEDSSKTVIWKEGRNFTCSAIYYSKGFNVKLNNPEIKEDAVILMKMDACDKYDEVHTYEIKGKCGLYNLPLILKITEIDEE
ncbi:MAG: hypothetical protein E7262_09635 [Lachnospiraceae bacterium]|nr:hypothetical protein [Lachnospiraceae bacterium]